jgi:hypothetical protein
MNPCLGSPFEKRFADTIQLDQSGGACGKRLPIKEPFKVQASAGFFCFSHSFSQRVCGNADFLSPGRKRLSLAFIREQLVAPAVPRLCRSCCPYAIIGTVAF